MSEFQETFVHGWEEVLAYINERFKSSADLKSILFIIGLQEIGKPKPKYTKEQKTDLMNLAACTVLSSSGYFTITGYDEDGWPHWKQEKALNAGESISQEKLLMEHVVKYFHEKGYISL